MKIIKFSGGRTSAYMTKRLIDNEVDRGNRSKYFSNTPKTKQRKIDMNKTKYDKEGKKEQTSSVNFNKRIT